MEYEDRITISAPEGIELEYTLAGLGSRFVAAFLDAVIRVVVLGAVIGLEAALGLSQAVLGITLIVGLFLALFGYDIAFDVWGGGRTPGKRWNGLRVLMANGQPVSFGPSAVRNLLRVIDIWATALIAGTVSITATRRNQRLGDLAAGTIVVRERRDYVPIVAPGEPTSAIHAVDHGIDVTAVTPPELAAIRDFLGRRERLASDARARVSKKLADSVSARVGGVAPGSMAPEQLLESIVAAKAAGGARYGSATSRDGG